MGFYIVKRIFYGLVVMWMVATLVFFMLRIIPGSPILASLGVEGDPAAAAKIRHQLGLDQPLYLQYLVWFERIFQGNLGNSLYGSHQSVSQLIQQAFPRTMSLATLSFVIALLLAVPAGIISAVKKHSLLDHSFTLAAFLGLSMPDFWLGILLIMLFAVQLHWLPAIGYVPPSQGLWPWFSHLILPATAIGTAFSAIIARMTRSALLEVMQEDYIRTARAKGLHENWVILKHALRNSLMPVMTVIGIAFALLMAGTVIVENVFAIRGLGRLLIISILQEDYPLVQGTLLVIAAIFVSINVLEDILYTYINPKIHY